MSPKMCQKCSKMSQNWEKLVIFGIMCILKKKYVKNYKVGVFLNKKRHDKLLSVEENWNKT